MTKTVKYRLKQVQFTLAEAISDTVAADPGQAAELIRAHVIRTVGWGREAFCLLGLSARMKPLIIDTVSIGTLSSCLVHPREVFRPAIVTGCMSVIVGHTHPSGDPTPSGEDYEVHRRLADAGQILGIPLVDSLVITPDAWRSCAAV